MEIAKLIAISYRAYQSFMREALKDLKLGNTDYPILLVLKSKPGVSVGEISRYTKISKGLISKSVGKLTDMGFVSVEKDEGHKQRMNLYLTQRGEEVIPVIREKKDFWMDSVLQGSESEEVRVFYKVMENIYSNSIKS